MRAIIKEKEPQQLREYRSKAHANYDGVDVPVKKAVRESLLTEQGSLCAYCMQRISAEDMKIEHWRSRSKHKYPAEQLDYTNLLGCCMGNKGRAAREQHCDTRKGDHDIKYNPAVAAHHRLLQIRYMGDGTIRSDDETFDDQIENVLNLNYCALKRNRRAVVCAVKDALSRKEGRRTAKEIQRLLSRWSTQDSDNNLQEYCDVAIYLLQKRLRRTDQH